MLPPNSLHSAIAGAEMVKKATEQESSKVRDRQHVQDRDVYRSDNRYKTVNQVEETESKEAIADYDHEEGQLQHDENPSDREGRQNQENAQAEMSQESAQEETTEEQNVQEEPWQEQHPEEEHLVDEPAEELIPILSQEEEEIEPPDRNTRTFDQVGENFDETA